jgi:WhiB family transcriptional regulator, redox-sensing transcriptional regulator
MRYPQFTGEEPCTQVGSEMFFPSDDETFYLQGDRVKQMCQSCPSLDPCLEYALSVRVQGIWGGTTEKERVALRRQFNIIPLPIVA